MQEPLILHVQVHIGAEEARPRLQDTYVAAAAAGATGTVHFCEPIPIFAVSCTIASYNIAASGIPRTSRPQLGPRVAR